jgi:hypothetical protein
MRREELFSTQMMGGVRQGLEAERCIEPDRNISRVGAAARALDGAHVLPHPRNVIAAGLLLTAAVVLAQAACQWVDFRSFDLTIRALDSDHHASVFGAASLLAQASAAAMALRFASSPRRKRWLIIAAIVGVLLIVRAFVRPPTTMLLLPLAAVFVSLCWLTTGERAGVRATVWGSLFLLVCSFALHVVGPQAGGTAGHVRDLTAAYQLAGVLKHGAELAGWMLLATGIAAAWSTYAGPSPLA